MSLTKNLRKLAVVGAIFSMALTGAIAAAPAQAAPAAPVQVSTSLTSPKFIADYNGGLYFTASPDGGNVYNIYFYDGSSDPKLVVGGEDSGEMKGHASAFDSKIFFSTGNAGYSIAAKKKLTVTKPFADLLPDKFAVVGSNLYFAGINSNQDTVIYKWTGGTTNPTSLDGVGNAPSNFRKIEVVGNRLAIMDHSRFLYLSSDASGAASPTFSHITFDVSGTAYETRESYGFTQVGNRIYFETHEMYNQTYVLMYVDIDGDTYTQATQILFSNGDGLVNASAPVLLGSDIYLIGSRVPNGGSAGPRTLLKLNSDGTVDEAPGITGAEAQLDFNANTFYGETNDTALGFFVVGSRLFMMDESTLNLYVYQNGIIAPLQYNGTQLQYLTGFTTVGSKMIFGATDPSATAGTPERNPVFTLDLNSGVITEVTVPMQLANAFLASGHMYFGGIADANSAVTLWVDEKPTVPTSASTKVSGFYGDSAWVSPALAKKLAKLVSSPSTITKVVCTGTTANTKVTKADKKLARARATAACKYIKSIAKNAKTTVVAKPSTGAGSSNRAVLVQITR